MPRQPRLDAPGGLHHVVGGGIERTRIFRTDRDREDFLNRLADLCTAGDLIVYAWALMPNHFHLLVLTGRQSISKSMRKLLTGYVVNFNLRHKRYGHLFQNRYKSIICEDDPYLLELTRYIHLNPLRADIVGDMKGLSNYRWTGHSAIMGKVKRDWQDIDTVLGYFGKRRKAVEKYEQYVREGVSLGKRPELVGGGVIRGVRARRLFCQLAVRRMGYPGAEVARFLGVTTSSVNRLAVSEEVVNLKKYLKLF